MRNKGTHWSVSFVFTELIKPTAVSTKDVTPETENVQPERNDIR